MKIIIQLSKKIELNNTFNPIEIIGINTKALMTIVRDPNDVNSLIFYVGGSSHYTKVFNSEQEREDYFNYLVIKVEIIKFIKIEGHNDRGEIVSAIINFNKAVRIDKVYYTNRYRIVIKIDGGCDIYFENINDANQYYDYIMEKLGAIKI